VKDVLIRILDAQNRIIFLTLYIKVVIAPQDDFLRIDVVPDVISNRVYKALYGERAPKAPELQSLWRGLKPK
jgi:hypothetical protein